MDDASIIAKYPGSVKFHLQQLNFKSVPKHILGFSQDYTFTKRRIDGGDTSTARKSWDSFSPLEQELCESNIQKMKQQQVLLRGWDPSQPNASSAALASTSKKRKAVGKKTGHGGGPPLKILKRGTDGIKQEASVSFQDDGKGVLWDAPYDDDDDDDDDETGTKKPSSWSKKDSKKLLEAVRSYGGAKIKWLEISDRVFHHQRSSRACHQHYHRFIVSRLVQGQWEPKEDSLIMELRNGKGESFADIAQKLPGRDELVVRDRYYHLSGYRYTHPKTRNSNRGKPNSESGGKKRRWTSEEDKIVTKNLAQIKSNQSWPQTLAQLPGRTKAAVTMRFYLNKERFLNAAASMNGDAEDGNKKSHAKFVLRAEAPPFVPQDGAAKVKLRANAPVFVPQAVAAETETSANQAPVENATKLSYAAVAMAAVTNDKTGPALQCSRDEYDI